MRLQSSDDQIPGSVVERSAPLKNKIGKSEVLSPKSHYFFFR